MSMCLAWHRHRIFACPFDRSFVRSIDCAFLRRRPGPGAIWEAFWEERPLDLHGGQHVNRSNSTAVREDRLNVPKEQEYRRCELSRHFRTLGAWSTVEGAYLRCVASQAILGRNSNHSKRLDSHRTSYRSTLYTAHPRSHFTQLAFGARL
jgi:hypothetical protein